MSKNLTRKGLALGALVALGSSVIAGAPAHAAGETITLASSYGTGTKTLLGSTFDLSSTFVGWSANPTAFSYFVTGATAAELSASTGVSTDHLTFNSTSDADTSSSEPTGVEVSFTGTEARGSYADLRLGLATSVTSTRTITVTAFHDDVITNGVIDAGEVASTPVSVTFVKPSEATVTTTLDKPVVGSTTLAAHVTLGDINLQQVTAGVVRVALTKNGATDTNNGNVPGSAAAWVKDDAALTKTFTTGAVTSSDIYTAQAYILDAGQAIGGTYSKAGSATALSTADAIAYEVSVGDITALDAATVNSAGDIRAKTTSAVAFKSEVKVLPAAAADYVAPAGIPAKVLIDSATLDATTTLTIGGKTVKNGETATISTVTDASGLVNFSVTSNTGKALDTFRATVSVADKSTGGYLPGTPVTYTYKTAVETKLVVDVAGNNVLSTTKGGAISLGVAVYDQFKQPFSSTDGFKVFTTSGTVTSGAAISVETPITAGKGTISVVDNSTTTGTYVLSVLLKEWNTATNLWDAALVDAAGTADNTLTFDVNVVSSNTVASLTGSTAAGNTAIDANDFKAANTATGASAPSATAYQTVSGKALAADGSALAGVPVTVSATGVQFKAGGYYTVDAITVRTNASGEYSVEYASHLKGKASLVVTSGAATKTVEGNDLVAPSTTASIKSVVVTGSTTLLPGRSVIYTVALQDKFGNPVETSGSVRVSYTGPGYFTTDLSSITAFGSKGTLSLTLITGATDSGAGTLTVTSYGADNVSSVDADKKDNVVVATTINVAAAPAPAVVEPTSKIGTANGRVYVNVKDGKGSVVSVKIGSKWTTKTALNNDYTFSYKNKKGAKVSVKVYVDGDLSASKTITVK